MISYETARADFEALEKIAELSDQVELDSDRILLMQNPTKEEACRMYQAAIRLWFGEHGVSKAVEIADRHAII